jgi:DNA-directed RNA polymerase omega subunit
MFKVSTQKLMKMSGGKYTLLEMAFERTHQLNNGAMPTLKTASKKNAMIALQEIAGGKVRLATDSEGEPESDESESTEE